jgi:hypothetical protein
MKIDQIKEKQNKTEQIKENQALEVFPTQGIDKLTDGVKFTIMMHISATHICVLFDRYL